MTRTAVLEMLLERVQQRHGQARSPRATTASPALAVVTATAVAAATTALVTAVTAAAAGPIRAAVRAALASVVGAGLVGDRRARLETLLERVSSRRRL